MKIVHQDVSWRIVAALTLTLKRGTRWTITGNDGKDGCFYMNSRCSQRAGNALNGEKAMSNAVQWLALAVRKVSSVSDPAACRAGAFSADGTISRECTCSEEQHRKRF
jgi:hypothetical protein